MYVSSALVRQLGRSSCTTLWFFAQCFLELTKRSLFLEAHIKKAPDEKIKQQQLHRFNFPLKALAQFEGNVTSRGQIDVLFSLKDYLQLVDTTGRMIRLDKRGAIPINLPPILERLSINRQQWLQQSQQFEKLYVSQFTKNPRNLKKTA
jgi:hypothetical protein